MADSKVVFETELDQSGLNGALKGLWKTVGAWAKGSAVAVGAVGTALAGLAKKAFEYNSQMETYQTNFAVLLGDEAKALEHVAAMREVAAKTPFGMEDLANASTNKNGCRQRIVCSKEVDLVSYDQRGSQVPA